MASGSGVKREGLEDEEEEDDIVISLTSRDPNMSLTQVRWDHTMAQFLGFNFSEGRVHLILYRNLVDVSIKLVEELIECSIRIW